MGSDLAVDHAAYGVRRFSIRVAGSDRIASVEILRNNAIGHTARPTGDVWEGEWEDAAPLQELANAPTFAYDQSFVFYYVRVRQANHQIAWASPFWLTQRAPTDGGAAQ